MKKTILTAVALFILSISQINAQSASFANGPADAAALSMGGMQYDTPARALFGTEKLYVGATYMMWQPSMLNASRINADFRMKVSDKFAFTGRYRMNMMQKMDVTNEAGAIVSSFSPKDNMFELGLGFGFGNFALSAAGKLITSNLQADAGATAFGFDAAATYRIGNLLAAAHIRNIGQKLTYNGASYPLPTRAGISVSDKFALAEKHSLEVAADVDYQLTANYNAVIAAIGAGYCYNNLIKLRLG